MKSCFPKMQRRHYDGRYLNLRRILVFTKSAPRREIYCARKLAFPGMESTWTRVTTPMEARLDGAISLTKGCYVGQEVVARATNLGGVPKLLMGLKLRSDSVPRKGARVLESEGKQIGTVTSGVFSPQLRTAIAFAYLKRNFARSGSVYDIEISFKRARRR